MNLTNGTLDTRLDQNLVKEFNIPANKEYNKFNPFKIGGGNAIWITHIPPNVKVWFSTNQNFDNAQRLDYMNRGMRYLEIGGEGMTRIYDNFYIFTEGVVDDDFIKICVSTQGANVEPILSSNTNQIDQVDAVGKIGSVNLIKSIEQLYYKPPIHQIRIQGEFKGLNSSSTPERYVVFPMGKDNTIKTLKLLDNKFYKISILGHFDIGPGDESDTGESSSTVYNFNGHLCLFNDTNGATYTEITNQEFDNLYSVNKRIWKDEKSDIFDIFGIKYMAFAYITGIYVTSYPPMNALNAFNDIKIQGNILNSYDYLGLCFNLFRSGGKNNVNESHSSLLLQIYELETL